MSENKTTYSCQPKGKSCYSGTIKTSAFGVQTTERKSCCSTNLCNKGEASTDSNTMLCEFKLENEKMTFMLGNMSCPAQTGKCAVC